MVINYQPVRLTSQQLEQVFKQMGLLKRLDIYNQRQLVYE